MNTFQFLKHTKWLHVHVQYTTGYQLPNSAMGDFNVMAPNPKGGKMSDNNNKIKDAY